MTKHLATALLVSILAPGIGGPVIAAEHDAKIDKALAAAAKWPGVVRSDVRLAVWFFSEADVGLRRFVEADQSIPVDVETVEGCTITQELSPGDITVAVAVHAVEPEGTGA